MIFTIVHSKHTEDKFPVSTTDDPKIFEFQNVELFDLRDIANCFKRNFMLNFPLKRSAVTRRKSTALEPLVADSSEYMILDFNDVLSEEARTDILSRFKGFKHVAFKTKSCDDIFSFNFRVILKIPASTRSKIRRDLYKIAGMLDPKLAKINTSLYNKAQITAAGNNGILSLNESGILFSIEEVKEASCWKFTPDIRDACILLYEEIGFKVTSNTKESIIFSSDLGDFIFFDSNPFEITNTQTGEKINIGKEFKKRYKIDDFRVTIPVKELMDWSNKNRIHESKSIDLSNIDPKIISKDISGTIANNRVLVLRSPMGSGKTRVIREFMNKSNSCLIITPRVSLADEFYERFKEDGCLIYNKHKLQPDSKLYICQFDSLYKIDVNQFKFDSIIIDEFMTLCDHMVSSIANNKEFNIAKFLALIQNSSSMLVCDAFMEKVSLDLIPHKFKEITWISNENRDSANVVIHKDINGFLASMIGAKSQGIVVSCVSVAAGIQISDLLKGMQFNVGLINADTPMNVRDDIIHRYKISKLNAIVYSPSVSVGVNILGLRGSHYHYDPGNVIPVIQSVQMLRRSRNSETIECFVKRSGKEFIPSLHEEKFNALQNPNCVTYSATGDRVLSDVGSFIASLNFHSKLWNIDHSKMFARLCAFNFRSVSSLSPNAKESMKFNIKLNALSNLKDKVEYQKLEIFGSKYPRMREVLQVDEIDDFLDFEKYYRICNRLEGFEIAHDDLIKGAHFCLQLKLDLFKRLQSGAIETKYYNKEECKLPESFVTKGGVLWKQTIKLNPKFLDLCDEIYNV